MKTSPEYKALMERIRDAESPETLIRLSRSAERIYNAGRLTVREYERLDVRIMERLAGMEVKP